jgi:RNA polymerase sigma-70 factor, ECF subfamily
VKEEIEGSIARALDDGDTARAATAAIRGYGPQLLGYLRAVLRDDALAGDAFAELSEALWVGLPAFRRECTVRTYSYKLARRIALDLIHDPYRKRGRGFASGELSKLVEEVRLSTAPFLRSDAKDGLAELRATLDPDEQTLLVLRIDRGLSWSEAAVVLECEEAALRKRFERLKERLRDLARARGIIRSG